MQIKTTWKYYVIQSRMAVPINLTINAEGNMERKESLFTVDGLDGAN